jgi:ribonuclease Y
MDLFVGFILGVLAFSFFYALRLSAIRHKALLIIQDAEKNSEKIKSTALLEIQKQQKNFELLTQQENFSLQQQKREIKTQQQKITSELDRIKKEERALTLKQKELHSYTHQAQEKLEAISKLSREEARCELMRRVEEELQDSLQERQTLLNRIMEEESRQKAHDLLFSALERKDSFITKESFLTDLFLPDQKFIPRLIGKEGRNIQTLEELLQVVLIIDENPPLLRISSFDPKARAIAKSVVERLIAEDKVTPITVRNAHQSVIEAFSRDLIARGKESCLRVHLADSFSEELLSTLGGLAFRTSYGQNVLEHSVEVAQLMGIAAKELGLRSETAIAMGLFHDIGKGISFNAGTSHSSAGKKFAQKNGLSEAVVNGIGSHHEEELPETDEARILRICDALSAQLPGVRHAHEPHFLQVVTQCETLLKNISGVKTAWAHFGSLCLEVVIRHDRTRSPSEVAEEAKKTLRSIPALTLPVRISLLP